MRSVMPTQSVLLVLVAAVPIFGTTLNKYMVPNTFCIDGSTAGFYYNEGNQESTKLVWYLEGGGECYTLADCNKWGQGRVPSDTWPATRNVGNAVLSRDCEVNPDFCDAIFIFSP